MNPVAQHHCDRVLVYAVTHQWDLAGDACRDAFEHGATRAEIRAAVGGDIIREIRWHERNSNQNSQTRNAEPEMLGQKCSAPAGTPEEK
jgi:hypothetical protein